MRQIKRLADAFSIQRSFFGRWQKPGYFPLIERKAKQVSTTWNNDVDHKTIGPFASCARRCKGVISRGLSLPPDRFQAEYAKNKREREKEDREVRVLVPPLDFFVHETLKAALVGYIGFTQQCARCIGVMGQIRGEWGNEEKKSGARKTFLSLPFSVLPADVSPAALTRAHCE